MGGMGIRASLGQFVTITDATGATYSGVLSVVSSRVADVGDDPNVTAMVEFLVPKP